MTRVGTVLSPLIVGRDDVLELAGRRLDEAAAGRGQFLLLSGEAGIGKTRLLRAIHQTAVSKGFRVGWGELAPQDRDVPAACFLEFARSATRKPEFGTLGNDVLRIVLDMTEARRPQRRVLVRRTVDAIQAAVTKPVLLVFEDLQWADDVSLEILGELARQCRDSPLFLAGAYRTDASKPGSMLREWRARLVTQRLVEEVRLDRLTLEETGLVTTLILGTGLPAPRDVVAAVHKRTDGVPLHIEELLGAVGADALVDSRSISESGVPETLEDAVLARAARLSDDAQAVARAGAVIGRCFVPEVLAGIVDCALRDLDDPLEELVANGFLLPFEYIDRGYYDFRHQLLRDALYASVPPMQLRRLHARAGEFGAVLLGANEIHASVHFERAGMHEEAFRAALSGARQAARLSSHREAFELYRRVVDNMPDDLPAIERGHILTAYADEAAAVEDNDLAARLSGDARDLYVAAGDAVNAVVALSSIGACQRRDGAAIAERIALAETMLAEAEALPVSAEREELRSSALGLLGVAYLDAGDLERARPLTMQSLALAEANGLPGEVLQARAEVGMLDVAAGNVEAGLRTILSAADEARAAGFEPVGVTAYRNAALMAVRSIEYAQARERLADGRRYADSIEQSHCARTMASTDAVLAWAGGDWDEAKRIGEQALADHGHGRAGAIARWSLGFVAAGRGDTAGAVATLAPALEFGRNAGWLEMRLPAQWGIAEAALMGDDPETTIRHCEEALAEATARDAGDLLVPFVVTGVRAYLAAGRPEAAQGWLERTGVATATHAPIASAALEHGRGLVLLARGSVGAARESLEAAVSMWDARGRTWEGLWARLDLAGALLRSKGYVAAARRIAQVREAAVRMGSGPLLRRAEELERLARGRGAEQEAWYPLTVREFEVARQIAAGLTNAEIAAELFVAPKTVSAHVEHILAKLGASRRAEIASWVSSIAQPVA